MLNQIMEPSEIMDLYFTKSNIYQSLWVLYIIVSIAIVVYVSGQPKSMLSGARKLTLIACFCIFGLINLFTLLQNKSDMENLKSASTMSLVADNPEMVNTYLLRVVDNSLGIVDWIRNHWGVILWHLALDGFVVLFMMLVFVNDKREMESV